MNRIINFLVMRRFRKQINLTDKTGILAVVQYFHPDRTCDCG